MKKIVSLFLLLFLVTTAKAQFKEGTKYVGTSFTGLSYNSNEHLRFGVQADAGYFFADSWMLHANVGFEHTRKYNALSLGASLRYYILQNGVYLSAGAGFEHTSTGNNDIVVPLEVGYTFYLNHYIAIEPALYYKISLNDFSRGSTIGLRIGLGYYF